MTSPQRRRQRRLQAAPPLDQRQRAQILVRRRAADRTPRTRSGSPRRARDDLAWLGQVDAVLDALEAGSAGRRRPARQSRRRAARRPPAARPSATARAPPPGTARSCRCRRATRSRRRRAPSCRARRDRHQRADAVVLRLVDEVGIRQRRVREHRQHRLHRGRRRGLGAATPWNSTTCPGADPERAALRPAADLEHVRDGMADGARRSVSVCGSAFWTMPTMRRSRR